jgi:hypothetical protein
MENSSTPTSGGPKNLVWKAAKKRVQQSVVKQSSRRGRQRATMTAGPVLV